jgi:hypothetical protein
VIRHISGSCGCQIAIIEALHAFSCGACISEKHLDSSRGKGIHGIGAAITGDHGFYPFGRYELGRLNSGTAS